MTPAELQQLIHCIDLTRLQENDRAENIQALCKQAKTPWGNVATVCIPPAFVATAWQSLMTTSIPIATVANFPAGTADLEKTLTTITQAIMDGAKEIDVVLPWFLYQQATPDRKQVRNFIRQCKQYCGQKALLKVILETGVLTPEQIADASEDAIIGGADFLKTSTGKITVGATPEAAKIMLQTIKTQGTSTGLKISGGIREIQQIPIYLQLFSEILQEAPLTSGRFRIGASQLLESIGEHLNGSAGKHAKDCRIGTHFKS